MVDLLVVLFFPAVLTVLLSIAELRIKYAEKELLNKIKAITRWLSPSFHNSLVMIPLASY